jgi:hypothetical protein
MKIVKKPIGGGPTSNVRPVRVNLPANLGGGFTMLMCFMDGGQSVAQFLRALLGMLQATHSQVLHVEDYGLTPHIDVDESDDGHPSGAAAPPPVFLHPDSLLADAFDDDELELNLDLLLLNKSKRKSAAAAAAATAGGHNSRDAASATFAAYGAEEGTAGLAAEAASSGGSSSSAAASSRRPPAPPTPPAQSVLHFTSLSKLRRLRPPADPPADVLCVTPLAAPCTLPFHLARVLPPNLATGPLTVALNARHSSSSSANSRDAAAADSAANTVAASSNAAAATPSSSAAAAAAAAAASAESKKERKEREKFAKALDAYALHVYDLLLSRGVGEDPHLKLQLAAQLLASKHKALSQSASERIGTSVAVNGAVESMWGGWEDEASAARQALAAEEADHIEVPILFVRTLPLPKDASKKFDVTAGQSRTNKHLPCSFVSTHLVGPVLILL